LRSCAKAERAVGVRCMLDTNILVSAALFPQSLCAAAYMRAVAPPFEGVVCGYILEELRRVFLLKFPHRLEAYAGFVGLLLQAVEVVATPPEGAYAERERQLGDIKDRPILRAALAANVAFLITGDKGFLLSPLQKPKMLSAAEFLRLGC